MKCRGKAADRTQYYSRCHTVLFITEEFQPGRSHAAVLVSSVASANPHDRNTACQAWCSFWTTAVRFWPLSVHPAWSDRNSLEVQPVSNTSTAKYEHYSSIRFWFILLAKAKYYYAAIKLQSFLCFRWAKRNSSFIQLGLSLQDAGLPIFVNLTELLFCRWTVARHWNWLLLHYSNYVFNYIQVLKFQME